jgi:dihydroneopterin aldolase
VGCVTDQINIRGIRGVGHHGYFEHERVNGQEFIVDVTLEVSTRFAAASDELADTVDYGVVAEQVHGLIVGDPVDLIETLAERIATACLSHSAVAAVDVRVHKPQAPITVPFDDVEVRIRRSADA